MRYSKKFVLKGGSLLTHVYGSPRQSIADADYVHLEPDLVKSPDLDDAFTVADGSFTMSALFRPVLDFKTDAVKGFDGKATFEIDGIELVPGDRRSRELKVTISIRPGEWLDQHDEELTYHDQLLTGDAHFPIQGLSRNELAAEKLLAWCSKDLPKHFVDLAYLKREHENALDYEKIADLVRRKFAVEKKDGRYQLLKIADVTQLSTRFTDQSRLKTAFARRLAAPLQRRALFPATRTCSATPPNSSPTPQTSNNSGSPSGRALSRTCSESAISAEQFE